MINREFTKPRRRHRGQRLLKNEFIFYLLILRYSTFIYIITLLITVKTIAELNPEHCSKFEIKMKKTISRRGVPFSRQHQGLLTTENLIFSRFRLVEDGVEMYKEL